MASTNQKLQDARKQRNWTIEQASAQIGVDIKTYRRWEQKGYNPSLRHLRRLCQIFELSPEELGFDI